MCRLDRGSSCAVRKPTAANGLLTCYRYTTITNRQNLQRICLEDSNGEIGATRVASRFNADNSCSQRLPCLLLAHLRRRQTEICNAMVC